MYIKNATAALIYRIAIVFVAGYVVANGFGVLAGRPVFCEFVFFTDVSNFLCFLYFLAAVVYGLLRPRPADEPRIFLPRVKGAVTFSITITLLVHHFVMGGTPYLVTDGRFDVGNLFAHYLTPVLAILDLVLFDPKGGMRLLDPLLYVLIPYTYLFYIFMRARLDIPFDNGKYYPYGFLNVSDLGVFAVARNIAMLSLLLLAIAYIGYIVDRILGRQR